MTRAGPVRLCPPARFPLSSLIIAHVDEALAVGAPAAGARRHRTYTERLTKPTTPERRRPRARNVSGGDAGHTRTPLGDSVPHGSANRRRRTYRVRESSQEHPTALTPFKEQTTTLEGTASPYPPERPATAHARAGPAPGRAGRRAGQAGGGSFPAAVRGVRVRSACEFVGG